MAHYDTTFTTELFKHHNICFVVVVVFRFHI